MNIFRILNWSTEVDKNNYLYSNDKLNSDKRQKRRGMKEYNNKWKLQNMHFMTKMQMKKNGENCYWFINYSIHY